MGNCSLKAVADSADGVDAIKIISTPREMKGPTRRGGATDHDQYFENFRVKREMANYRFRKSVEVLPATRNGVWKVKLVVDSRDLEDIFSEQVNAEALIQKMRSIAAAANSTPRRSTKGGGGGGGGTHLPYMCSYK